MNRYKLHRIVEYIRIQTEFPFDVLDVEQELEAVLAYYGFHPELDELESIQLTGELRDLALTAELAEVARVVEEDHDLGSLGRGIYPEMFMRQSRPKSVPFDEWLQGLGAPKALAVGCAQ